jgi:hypothetical protein
LNSANDLSNGIIRHVNTDGGQKHAADKCHPNPEKWGERNDPNNHGKEGDQHLFQVFFEDVRHTKLASISSQVGLS